MGLMRSHGYEAEAFGSAADYLAAERKPGCLVADIHMPGMTGLELCKLVGEETPVILITARDDEGLRTRARRSGAFCYLAKPVREDRLLECLQAAMKDRGAGRNQP